MKTKILIINQHKGDFDELVDHLENYSLVWKSSNWFMILIIDMVLEEEDKLKYLKEYQLNNRDKIKILYNDMNTGLTPSRVNVLGYAIEKEFEFEAFYFNSTNSRWVVSLTDDLACDLIKYVSLSPTLIKATYVKSQYDGTLCKELNDHPFNKVTQIPFETYLGDSNRRDYGLLFPQWAVKDIIGSYDKTPNRYIPEEIWLWNVSCKSSLAKWLQIYPIELQEAWYNPNGLTKSFDRKFVLENKESFAMRAHIFIHDYMKGYLTLSMYFLKILMYDYVTLSDSFNPREFQGTPLEAVMKWSLDRWLYNPDYNHKLKFMEENK